MHINIIGDGSAGQRHARMLRELGHECVILGPDKASPTQHPPCDACVIATPPSSHKLYLSWYHDKCPVLCEGPITWAPAANKFPHMYAANWCFVPQIVHLTTLTKTHKAVIAHLHFDYDLILWRKGWDYRTSCYYTDGIDYINHHEVATAIHLFGSINTASVYVTHSGKSLETDAVAIAMEHTSGTLTTINSSWHSTQYKRGVSVVFDDGTTYDASWTSPQDDHIVNRSYLDMLLHWLSNINNNGCNAWPSLQMGRQAFGILQGEYS